MIKIFLVLKIARLFGIMIVYVERENGLYVEVKIINVYVIYIIMINKIVNN